MVNGIGMSWVVTGIALLSICVMALALFWQIMRRREAMASLEHFQLQLAQTQHQGQQREADLREQKAAARAEKAHADQLQRQLDFAQDELSGLRDEQKLQFFRQSQASAAQAQHVQLIYRVRCREQNCRDGVLRLEQTRPSVVWLENGGSDVMVQARRGW